MQKAARWSCCVCGRGVCSNTILCTSCQKWVHKKCSGIKVECQSDSHLFVEVA